MKNKYFKIIIAVLMILLSIYLFYERETAWAIVVLILTIIPIFLFFRNEYILLAFWKVRNQKMEDAEKWLNKITNMEQQIIKKQYGYFHYLKGLIAAKNNELSKLENLHKKALEYGLTFDQDKAMANFYLGMAAANKGRKQEAEKYFNIAKKLDSANLLSDEIKLYKNQMKKINVGKHIHNPHMRHRGKF